MHAFPIKITTKMFNCNILCMTPNGKVRYIFNIIAKIALTQHHDFEKNLDKKAQINAVG